MPTAFRLIGLTGFAGSGKDTAAKTLIGEGFTRIAFADPLRAMLYALNPIINPQLLRGIRLRDEIDLYGWEAVKREYPEVREQLQRLGTEGGRDVLGQNVWVDAAFRKQQARTVITDVRFDNEAEAINDRGGSIINIVRPGTAPVNAHVSESGIAPRLIAHTIINDGTEADLHDRVLATLRGYANDY